MRERTRSLFEIVNPIPKAKLQLPKPVESHEEKVGEGKEERNEKINVRKEGVCGAEETSR